MKWSATGDREVVEAVLSVFSEPELRARQSIAMVELRQWARSCNWLDASGMALYFLAQVESAGIEGVLPIEVLTRLRQNRSDNRARTAALFADFVSLNQAFQQAGIDFCNLKGFTLTPDSSPSPELRCQLDLDFLVDGKHVDLCSALLVDAGYVLTGSTRTVREFKTGVYDLVRIEDHYKPRPQRSVELHFTSDAATQQPARDPRLDRLNTRAWEGGDFPVLSDADQFLAQVKHLFAHLCSPSTRLSWLLEYKRNLDAHATSQRFWNDVRDRSRDDRTTPIAIGVATLLATRLFGGEAPAYLNTWTLDRLPIGIRLWAETHGANNFLQGHSATKRYLLLRDELHPNDRTWQKEKRASLLPLRRVPRIVHVDPSGGPTRRLRAELLQLRYILFRLRFHVVEGLRYVREAARWKRQLAALDRRAPRPHTDASRTRKTPAA